MIFTNFYFKISQTFSCFSIFQRTKTKANILCKKNRQRTELKTERQCEVAYAMKKKYHKVALQSSTKH